MAECSRCIHKKQKNGIWGCEKWACEFEEARACSYLDDDCPYDGKCSECGVKIEVDKARKAIEERINGA